MFRAAKQSQFKQQNRIQLTKKERVKLAMNALGATFAELGHESAVGAIAGNYWPTAADANQR